MKKQLPKFKSEDEEREFWSKHDSTEYIDWDNAKKVAVRGKYAKSLKKGYSVRILKADGTVDEFDILVKQARKQAKVAKLKKRDIKSAIAKVRKSK